jgi:hypothetical protein
MTQLWVTLSLDDDDESEVLQRALRHYWAVRRREKRGGSGYFKRFRAMFRKAVKERSSLMLLELELHAVEAALKNFLDVCEREIAKMARPRLSFQTGPSLRRSTRRWRTKLNARS